MIATDEIASITILVPYQKGNELVNQIIPFKVFRQQQQFKAIPLINAEERMLTGLSDELTFRFVNHRILPETEANKATLEAINNIVRELKMLHII